MRKVKWSKRIVDSMLAELWDNAAFLSDSYKEFEEYVNNNDGDKSYGQILNNLTTIRNRFLIDQEEQHKLRDSVVAFFGLSVGSHAALTWAMQSRARKITISDPDKISASNLNRIRTKYSNIGKYKANVFKKELLAISPAMEVDVLINSSVDAMRGFCQKSRPDMIVDAIDDLKGKLFLRRIAKELRVPLLMATDVGNNVLLDIERYDLDKDQQYFNGRVERIEDIDFDQLSMRERLKMVYKIVGFEEHSSRMLWSLKNIGKEVLTWPQLGATATIAGGVITTAIVKIILGEKIKSGRYIFSVDSIFCNGTISQEEKMQISNLTNDLKNFKDDNE